MKEHGSMMGMFYDCSSLSTINLSAFDVSSVTDMSNMFENCTNLYSININNWNTSNVTSMLGMFRNCSSLFDINLNNLNTTNVTDMRSMFDNCSSFGNNMDFNSLNTSNVRDIGGIFYNCNRIGLLDLSNWDLSKGQADSEMFDECAFETLVTPKAIGRYSFELPYKMYDIYGTEYYYLPSASKTLYKYKQSVKYNITLIENGGTINSGEVTQYTVGVGATLPTDVTKEGYEFIGWYDNEELTGSPITSISSTETGDKTFYAKWERNTFTVTFKDGTQRQDVQTINSGENAIAPNWTKSGYTLTWDTEFTNVTSDLTVNAIWTARSDTPYKVIHHFRNLDTEVEGYIEEEEAKTGTTDTTVTAEYKTREGFTKNENHTNKVETGTVTGDGSLILHLYYNRNTYNITYELNGGTQSSPLTNKYVYGKEMILQTNRVTKEGYTFAGWYDNEELEGSPVASISATSTGNKTFYAKWVEAEKEYYILSEIYNIDLTENTITKVSPETNVTEFLSKIDTNGQMKVVNARGEEITDTSLVGTGYKLQVTFKGEVHTYEIAVRGDLDGNGKITTTDLSIINQQILHKIELTGIRAKAADTDYNGRLTTTDLSMINQAVLRKITL